VWLRWPELERGPLRVSGIYGFPKNQNFGLSVIEIQKRRRSRTAVNDPHTEILSI
jgi:hypothetical protein